MGTLASTANSVAANEPNNQAMIGFVLSPDAEEDIWLLWQYLLLEAGLAVAHQVESTIFEKIELLARMPGAGHSRRDLTDEPVKFFAAYSYLIVYRPETKPLQVVAVLHGRRDSNSCSKTVCDSWPLRIVPNGPRAFLQSRR